MAINKNLLMFFLFLFFPLHVFAENRTVNLIVEYQTVYLAGKPVKAIVVNNQIPGPTLHFKLGDQVTLNVYNQLDKETAIHWHGLLVPWQMDGVMGITQKGIPAGGVFHYKFTLHQSGTYWYHAHAGLQEQQGLYGAFLIDPLTHPAYKFTKDYTVVLSDWSNTDPEQILANLKKEGDYYSPKFPLQPSLIKFIHDYRKSSVTERKDLIDDYKMMQQMRMSIYDFSDVAYDAFLLNGKPKTQPWTVPVKMGDIVRLRFVGAGASTIFHVKIPETSMQVVQIDGNEVQPYSIDEFRIAPGETYDVLVKIKSNKPYIIYAESIDTVGAAYGALITAPNQFVDYKHVAPFPEPLPVTREMMSTMMSNMNMHSSAMKIQKPHKPTSHLSMAELMKINPEMKMDGSTSMRHSMPTGKKKPVGHPLPDMKMNHAMNMNMPTEPTIMGDKIVMDRQNNSSEAITFGTKYQDLKAAVKTNDPQKPVTKIIRMELFGYMDRYIWFINGVPEHNAQPILFEPGKRYRFIFTNPSMMTHPMHLHGHWFILRNGHGSYDPLLHTISIPPGATVTADVDTDASGQWLFHCHLLYHMMTGMARVFQYTTLIEIINHKATPQDIIKPTAYYNRPIVRVDEVRPIDPMLVHHHMAHAMGIYSANFLDIGEDPFHNVQKLDFKGLYGRDYDKLEIFINDAEIQKGTVTNADADIFYWHLLSQFWAIKGGVNYFNRPALTPYWQPGIGIEGLMPYFIDTDIRGYYHGGAAKLDMELFRDSQMTNNFFIRVGVRSIIASKTVTQAQIGSGLNQMRYILRPYYRLMPGLDVFAEYEHEQDYGAFRNMQINANDSSIQNTLTFGISILF